MNLKKTRFFAAVLGAVCFASLKMAGGIPPAADSPGALRYETSCAVIDSNSVDGYVTNQSPDVYQVTGQVRFVFSAANSMSRPAIVYAANSMVQAGQSVRVARVKLAFQPLPGETCRFEVKDAIRKG